MLKRSPEPGDAGTLIDVWEQDRKAQIERCRQVFADVRSSASIDMPMVSVVLRELRSLT